jgi:hypothetical protein
MVCGTDNIGGTSMRKISLLLVVIFATSLSFSREAKKTGVRVVNVVITPSLQKKGEVFYTSTPLTWEDFQDTPDTGSEWVAVTHSGVRLRYEYQTKGDTSIANVMVYPYMDKKKSWYIAAGYNDITLLHEQRHFDIASVIANELAEEIRHTDFNFVDFSSAIMKLHTKYMNKLDRMQEEYDEATAHGTNMEQQQVWNEKLSKKLSTVVQ